MGRALVVTLASGQWKFGWEIQHFSEARKIGWPGCVCSDFNWDPLNFRNAQTKLSCNPPFQTKCGNFATPRAGQEPRLRLLNSVRYSLTLLQGISNLYLPFCCQTLLSFSDLCSCQNTREVKHTTDPIPSNPSVQEWKKHPAGKSSLFHFHSSDTGSWYTGWRGPRISLLSVQVNT